MFAVSSDGSTHFFKENNIVWQKEESLAYAKEVEFLDLPERKLWTQEVDELGMDIYFTSFFFFSQFNNVLFLISAEQPEESEAISPFIRYIRRLRTHFEQLKVRFIFHIIKKLFIKVGIENFTILIPLEYTGITRLPYYLYSKICHWGLQ